MIERSLSSVARCTGGTSSQSRRPTRRQFQATATERDGLQRQPLTRKIFFREISSLLFSSKEKDHTSPAEAHSFPQSHHQVLCTIRRGRSELGFEFWSELCQSAVADASTGTAPSHCSRRFFTPTRNSSESVTLSEKEVIADFSL